LEILGEDFGQSWGNIDLQEIRFTFIDYITMVVKVENMPHVDI